MTTRMSAVELIGRVVDDASFSAWDDEIVSTDPLSFTDTMSYRERLRLSGERSGANESITTGRACLDGRDVVVIAGEFHFLAGTLGVATAARVVGAFDRATELRLPVIALPISGGTRMQEGVAAFIQMAACAAAVRRFRDAGLLYAVYLRNPTTGGVLASWALLAQVRWAEPGALIGLTGPRVAKEMTGQPFPEGVQVAEHLAAHGVIDEVVPLEDLRARLAALVAVAVEPGIAWEPAVAPAYVPDDVEVGAWDAVQWSRRPDRPGLTQLLAACGEARVATLSGDGAGEDDDGCLVAVSRLCGHAVVVVAPQRAAGQRGASLTAAGYRKARRGIALAGELDLPLVTVIDTAGAAITPHDEESGLAGMIAECLAAMSSVRSPTLSVLLGEGAGGGAVALLPADRVLAAEHAWLAPIAPEGASAILYRTADRAPEVAAAQHIATPDLRALGVVDAIVPDRGADAPAVLAAAIAAELGRLVDQEPIQRLAVREDRYRTAAR